MRDKIYSSLFKVGIRRTRFCGVFIVTFLLGLVQSINPSVTFGQNSSSGAISGVVSDASGGVVADAEITVISGATGEKHQAKSQGGGNYTVPLLPPGNYSVRVAKAGFKTATAENVTVNVTETSRVDIRLEVGENIEKVIVTTEGEILQTESSAQGRVVDGRAIQNLPLAVGNYTQIIALSPGVSADVNRADDLGRGNGGLSGASGTARANGGSSSDTNFNMDGQEVNDRQGSGGNSGGAPIPNPESIQEFKVQTSQYDATYGRNSGANVDVVTRGGSNSFHGGLWENFRNDVLNANDFFLNQAKQPRASLKQNQFGANVSGPILKDKLLFFTSYQGTRQRNGFNPACKTNLRGLPAGITNNNRTVAGLEAAFGGAQDSQGRTIMSDGSNIASQAVALLQMKLPNGQYVLPTPQALITQTVPGPMGPQTVQFGTYVASQACPFNEDQFLTNADIIPSYRNRFAIRFFFANSDATQTFPPGLFGGGGVPGFPSGGPQNFRTFSLTHNYVFGTHLLNQASVGFHRTYNAASSTTHFTFSDLGANVPAFDNTSPSIGIFQAGYNIVGDPGLSKTGRLGQNTYDVQDLLSYTIGLHSLRLGGGVTRAYINRHLTPGENVIFQTFPDFLLGSNGDVLNSIDLPAINDRNLAAWDGNAFIQDDLKVKARLTLNIGFRYERAGDLTEKNGFNVGFDPSLIVPFSNPSSACTGSSAIGGAVTGSLLGYEVSSNYRYALPCSEVNRLSTQYGFPGNDQNTWNPRFGFAWRLPHTERLLLRGGYGIYHAVSTGNTQLQTSAGQPFVQMRGLFGANNVGQTWAQPFPAFTSALPFYTPYTLHDPSAPGAIPLAGVTAFASNFRPPVVQQYSLNVQTELSKNVIFEIGYLGVRGQHIMDTRSVNQAALASVVNAANSSRGVAGNTTLNVYQRVPYAGFDAVETTLIESEGSYWYNALEASLTKRLSSGLQFQVSYTFTRDLSTQFVGDQNNPSYGPDPAVRPHRFVASYVYNLPKIRDKESWTGKVANGWRLSGVTTYQSGRLLTLTAPGTLNIYGIVSSTTASLAAGCKIGELVNSGLVQSKLNSYFNESCVTYPAVSPYASSEPALAVGQCNWQGPPAPRPSCAQATGFGNLGVGVVSGPDEANWDMAISRNFHLPWPKESANLEFKTDFFNAFNHAQFSDPNTSILDPIQARSGGFDTFGQIFSTSVNPRIIQFSLRINF